MYCLQELVMIWHGEVGADGQYYASTNTGESGWSRGSCDEVRRTEFGGHALCYLGGPAPISGVRHTAICNLSQADLRRIFLTVKATDGLTMEGIVQTLQVAETCLYLLAIPGRDAEEDEMASFWREWVDWARSAVPPASAPNIPLGYSCLRATTRRRAKGAVSRTTTTWLAIAEDATGKCR